MQLMPPTARWVAKQLNRADYRPSQIADAGDQHAVRRVLFQVLARPARSDAGARRRLRTMPGPAARRRGAPATPLEGAVWVETIPFNETRDYVKKVLANAMFYARSLESGLTCRCATRLGTVQPRGDAAPAHQRRDGD